MKKLRKRGEGSVYQPGDRNTWTIKWREWGTSRVETGFKTEEAAHAALDNRVRERDLDRTEVQRMDDRARRRREDDDYQSRCREIDKVVASLVAMEDFDFLDVLKLAAEGRGVRAVSHP